MGVVYICLGAVWLNDRKDDDNKYISIYLSDFGYIYELIL